MAPLSRRTLGSRIAAARRASPLTQAELARAASLDRKALSKSERGGRNVGSLELVRIARALRQTVDRLLADSAPARKSGFLALKERPRAAARHHRSDRAHRTACPRRASGFRRSGARAGVGHPQPRDRRRGGARRLRGSSATTTGRSMARGGRYAERPRARLLRDRRRARMGDRREGPSEAQGADPLDRRRDTRGGRREAE